jgi:hypothetical protein
MLSDKQLELFKQRVGNGQSLQMLKWEFKLTEHQVRSLSKKHNLILNSVDYLNYSYKITKAHSNRKVK